jgi:uncharacterized protein with FMN-binding domain
MKRLIVTAVVVVAFALYAIFGRGGTAGETATAADGVASTSSSGSTTTLPSSTQGQTVASTTSSSQAAGTTTTASSGYADGTYTGSGLEFMYGTVQVEAVIEGGQITEIQFLSIPSGRRESDEINGRATPILKQEAIAAQSAHVQVVSGATLTSRAFMESLQSALDQAQS